MLVCGDFGCIVFGFFGGFDLILGWCNMVDFEILCLPGLNCLCFDFGLIAGGFFVAYWCCQLGGGVVAFVFSLVNFLGLVGLKWVLFLMFGFYVSGG